jgi:macrolide transport system ATP-binding/permease protein
MPVIQTIDLARTYHVGDIEVQALRGVSLTIERGEFVAIVGASGSGKSTMMAILGCLDRPTRGQYLFEGVDVAGLPEPSLARLRSERIGFVFQSFNLLARTNAVENIALPLFYSTHGAPTPAKRRERARRLLQEIGLADREENTPAQLSGGQQQRVAIARALVNSPAVLLADEPTGNLDSKTSQEIMATLTALNREQHLTIVLVTHEPDIAAYADRVVTMRDGEIVSDERRARTAVTGTDAAVASSGAGAFAFSPAEEPAALASVGFASMIVAAAVQAIRRNTLRSALTMLGVFIGVAALIAMVAVGQGANAAVRSQLERLGTNLVVVVPGAATSGGARGGSGSASTLTVADAEAIARDSSAVAAVAYLNRQQGQVQYANKNWLTSIQGVSDNYPQITNWSLDAGRWLTKEDTDSGALNALIGHTVATQLFGPDANPIGAQILVKSTPMRVVGLLTSRGQSGFGQDQDDLIMIPFTTAEQKVLGVASPSQISAATPNSPYPPPVNPYGIQPRLIGFVNSIYVQASDSSAVERAIAAATATLAQRHHIEPGSDNDFSVRNLSEIQNAAESSSRVFALLLAAVASISLVVGGIGIMNILLVSVTERTREIGLRMAIGARRLHVLLQFLAEAVLLSASGGALGVAAGIAASLIISAVADWPTQLPALAIVGGFLFSAAVGVFFGFYPARQAARLDPIEALRFE